MNPATKTGSIGEPPKIGIRPTIDGRRQGVRESLEEITMNMAKSVAEFLSTNLRHADGLPVECVIADTCIGGVAEAAQTADKFATAGGWLIDYGNALLVLWIRNDGHDPSYSQSGLGL